MNAHKKWWLMALLLIALFGGSAHSGVLNTKITLESGASAPSSDIDIKLTMTKVGSANAAWTDTVVMLSGQTSTSVEFFGGDFNPTVFDAGNYILHIACVDPCPNVVQSGYYHSSPSNGLVSSSTQATVISMPAGTSVTNAFVTMPLTISISGQVIRPPELGTTNAVKVQVRLIGDLGTNVHDSVEVTLPAGVSSAPYQLFGYPNYVNYRLRYDCNQQPGCTGIVSQGYRIDNNTVTTDNGNSAIRFNTALVPLTNRNILVAEGNYVQGKIQFAANSGLSGTFSGTIKLCAVDLSTNCYQHSLVNANLPHTYKIYTAPTNTKYNLSYHCSSCPQDTITFAYSSVPNTDNMSIYIEDADDISISENAFGNNNFLLLPDLNLLKGVRILGQLKNSAERQQQNKIFNGKLVITSKKYPRFSYMQEIPRNTTTAFQGYPFSFLVPKDSVNWDMRYQYVILEDCNACYDANVLQTGYYAGQNTTTHISSEALLLTANSTHDGIIFPVVSRREVGLSDKVNIIPLLKLLLLDED